MTDLSPGIYYDIPAADYHALPYISNSYLGRLKDCPAAAKVPQEDTPAMAVGRAAHCLILEADVFDDKYCIGPSFDRRTKAGKQAYEAFLTTLNGRESIDQDTFDRLYAMSRSITRHPSASGLIQKGKAEVTLIWVDDPTGLTCKARVDWLPDNVDKCFIDLKTTKDAEERPFLNSVLGFGYHRQAAFYLDGANALGLPYDLFGFVAVEQEAPHRCEVYTLSQAFVDHGRKEYRDLMTVEMACREAGEYPAYKSPGITELDLPGYLKPNNVVMV